MRLMKKKFASVDILVGIRHQELLGDLERLKGHHSKRGTISIGTKMQKAHARKRFLDCLSLLPNYQASNSSSH